MRVLMLFLCLFLAPAASPGTATAAPAAPVSPPPLPRAADLSTLAVPRGPADPVIQARLDAAVDSVRARYEIPALTVRVWEEGEFVAGTTRGVRELGEAAAATDEDLWHIGSCAKIVSAVAIARLVDRGLLTWDAPLERLLPPEMLPLLHPGFRAVTLAQLLTHTSGMTDPPIEGSLKGPVSRRFPAVSDAATREAMQAASAALERAPATPPGTHYAYANWGYVTAAVVASHADGRPWEQLLAEEVFRPLGITHFGFGAPGSAALLDQPCGHELQRRFLLFHRLTPRLPDDPDADNPRFIDAAGRLHLGMDDWYRFSRVLLEGFRGRSDFLAPATFQRVLTPAKADNADYYAFGVGLLRNQKGEVRLMTHTGSNGYWRADFRIFTATGRIYLMAANRGTEDMDMAFDALRQVLNRELDRRAAARR